LPHLLSARREIEMIGHVVMEIGEQEMIVMVQFYLNSSVFTAEYDSRKYHRANVVSVKQRSNGRFVIDFDGLPERQEQSNGTDDIS
jgi:hypothetical protein